MQWVDPRNTVSSNGRYIIAYGPAAGSGFGGMGLRDQIELAATAAAWAATLAATARQT